MSDKVYAWLLCMLIGSYGLQAATADARYNIRTFAGANYTGDGRAATSGILVQPEGVFVDSRGEMYIADPADNRIRKVDGSGRILTIAGAGYPGFWGDGGPATRASLNSPYDVCVDSAGNVYIADLGNGRVRKINPDGVITTFAGGGDLFPDPLYNMPAKSARLMQPRNLAVDSRGNVYISDFGAHRVYQVTAEGTLSAVAGTGQPGISEDSVPARFARLWNPAGLAFDTVGNLYIADSGNRRVRRLSGQSIMTLKDSAGQVVRFTAPTGVTVDGTGKLYVADGTSILSVSVEGGLGFITIASTAVKADPAGRLLVSTGPQVVRLENGTIAAVAGSGVGAVLGDGRPMSEWRFSGPAGIVRDASGNLYIADSGNGRVRQIQPTGVLSTVIDKLKRPSALAIDSADRLFVADAATGTIYRHERGVTQVFSTGSEAMPFNRPSALAFDARGNLFVADTGNNLIRRISPDGTVAAVAGGGGLSESNDPLRLRLADPAGVAVDAQDNLWITEAASGLIRKLEKNGKITTLKLDLKEPRAVKIDKSGAIFVCDATRRRVYRISSEEQWWPIAGTGELGISDAEGQALDAPLMTPLDLWLETNGNILIADAGAGRIRELIPQEKGEPTAPGGSELQVRHAALARSDAFAPGQIVVLRGATLSGLSVSELKVSVGAKMAAVISASNSEVAVQLPLDLAAGNLQIEVAREEQKLGTASLQVAASAPGIFAEQTGQALALNEDGSRNALDSPADRGTVVTFFGTGQGTEPMNVTVQVGGIAAEVVYAGPAPGQPGVFQVNVRTPAGFVPAGVQSLSMSINGVSIQSGITIVTR